MIYQIIQIELYLESTSSMTVVQISAFVNVVMRTMVASVLYPL